MVCLSFDLEEFDIPFEYGGSIGFEEQIAISRRGTRIILDLLAKHNARATFFTTVVFAKENPDLIREIVASGHELASHTYYHSKFKLSDLKKSRLALEEISGQKIFGLRMPRMQNVGLADIAAAGYTYDSSLNPTWLPGRYNNLKASRTIFREQSVFEIPASVTPALRLPLFWLMFHHLPLALYWQLAQKTYRHDHFLNIYFHPWEFVNIYADRYKIPKGLYRNMGSEMIRKFGQFLDRINRCGWKTATLKEYLSNINNGSNVCNI